MFEIAKTSAGYASTPTTLVSFNGNGGSVPLGSLIADANGDLFGTTYEGGASGDGTAFEIAKTSAEYASTPTTLVSFNGADGAEPFGGLIADANGDLFGATRNGGANNIGTVFEIRKTPTGYASTPTTLVSFNGNDGAEPFGSLIADASGDLFGTTYGGGANGGGTVFEITGSGFIPPGASPVVTVAQFFFELTTLDANPLGFIVSDTAANVAGVFDALNADSHVDSISLTDPRIPLLNLTDLQATEDTRTLGEIANLIFEVQAPAMAPPYYVDGNGASGPALRLSASNSTVVERANSNVKLTGSNDTVTMAAGSNLTVSGSTDAIAATTGDGITISSGTGDTITGAGLTITAASGTGLTRAATVSTGIASGSPPRARASAFKPVRT